MGAEIYAHFDFDQGEMVESDELRELQEDAGTSDVPSSSSGHAVARVDAGSGVTAGERDEARGSTRTRSTSSTRATATR